MPDDLLRSRTHAGRRDDRGRPGHLQRTARDQPSGVDHQLRVLRQLFATVPRQQSSELLGERRDALADRLAHGFGPVASENGAVLHARLDTVAFDAWQVQQHCEASGALDQRANRRPVGPDDEIALPAPGIARSSTSAGRSLIMTSGVT